MNSSPNSDLSTQVYKSYLYIVDSTIRNMKISGFSKSDNDIKPIIFSKYWSWIILCEKIKRSKKVTFNPSRFKNPLRIRELFPKWGRARNQMKTALREVKRSISICKLQWPKCICICRVPMCLHVRNSLCAWNSLQQTRAYSGRKILNPNKKRSAVEPTWNIYFWQWK